MHVCLHVCVCTCVCVCEVLCTCVCVCVIVCVCMCVCVHVYFEHMRVCVCLCMLWCVFVHVCMHMHVEHLFNSILPIFHSYFALSDLLYCLCQVASFILLDIVLMLVVTIIYQLIAVATIITFNKKKCVATK